MTSRPRVSVIMPAYNTSAYVAAAIRSVRRQTVRDIELIVVDDGSKDRTFGAALSSAGGDPRVRVITQANAGPSAARNRAMKLAKGAFLALLDSDDEWMPTFLEAQLKVFERRPSTAIVTANAINNGGSFDGRPYWPIRPAERPLSFLDLVQEEDAVCIMSVFRRAVFETIGAFDESLRGNEDYDFWLRAARHGFEIVQTFEPLGFYRRRPDSASADDRRMVAGILRVLDMTRDRCRTTTERAVVERQVSRFERAALEVNASWSLRHGDFGTAAGYYERLYRRSTDLRGRTLVLAARRAPLLLACAVRARTAFRKMAAGIAAREKTLA